ncbi:antibiotic biosynthesis monooxygenase [Ponticaulis sp.]|uniref:antibiotic biosynthesis monooxygenase n=1 Tax=Ponticaulis sp. TaxID=2020902 RepID=UPI000B67FAC1|nr:antibiotic biosynthesis monooxygenase [Ponticaulis sp.]MAI91251.1 antibiotic biosynthesis monooxygenase [Ponticaulis sp.]OUX98562.1 MAG: antibiotic biosynthesis monooxygenase [Hyphomonadaceae bacterium TMED5]|tara:strand:- start:28572 stop:29150 length:579 start_codon:yes stop_codon:yes gene_type:complete
MAEDTDTNAPITVVVSRRVKPGQEAEFERLSSEMTASASDFDGHMGANMFRPSTPADPEYRIIFKFRDDPALDVWLKSDTRAHYLEQIEPLLIEPGKVETLSSLVTWFTIPGHTPVKPPPRYKMAVVSWLGLFPIVLAIFWIFEPWLIHIPLIPRVALVTAAVMVIMTWVAMPRITKLFAGWLYPKSGRDMR